MNILNDSKQKSSQAVVPLLRFLFFISTLLSFRLHGEAATIEYLHSYVLNTATPFFNSRIGGLSGLAFKDGLYWAVSDDKGTYGELRVVGFNVQLNEKELSIIPIKTLFLKDEKGNPFLKKTLDLEGIVAQQDSFIISNEGLLDHKPRTMPSLIEFSASGLQIGQIKLPELFNPEKTGKQKTGVRSNGSFEGLSLSPSGQYLWALAEQPLLQDHKKWQQGDAGETRLLRFKKSKEGWQIDGEWIYPIDAVSVPSGGSVVLGQGCSEILAISDTELIVMERAAHTNGLQVNYDIKLYQTSVRVSAASKPQKTLSKALLFNFDTIKEKMADGKGLDNFEGLAWGPEVKGQKTLLVVSDDNFISAQRTLWVALKWVQ